MAKSRHQMIRRLRYPQLASLAVCVALLFGCPGSRLFAADGTWTNTAGGTLAWTNITNWSGGIAAGGTDAIANFATVNIANTTVTLAGTNPTVGTLLFADTSGGQTWGINNAGAINLSVTSGSPLISNSVTTTLSGILAGSQGFTKAGSGVLILGGANTYSGNTVISDGTLRLNANETLPNASVVVFSNNANNKELTVYSASDTIGGLSSSGGAGTIVVQNNRALNTGTLNLNVATATSQTYDGIIRDAAAGVAVNNLNIIKSGTGTQVFSGGANVSYSGATTVNDGTLEFSGATVNNNSAISVSSGATMRFNNTSTIDRTTAITGAGNVEKSGSGVLTLSAANTYGGSTIMTGGNLRLGANDRIADTSVMRFTGGSGTDSRFQMMGYSETLGGLNSDLTTGTQVIEGATTAAATLTLSVGSGAYTYGGFLRDSSAGTHANNLSLVKNGAGTQVLSGAGNVAYSGTTTINGGTLEFSDGTVNNNSAINVADSSAAMRFNVSSGTVTRTHTISGSGTLVKVGAGALVLSNVNTYTGATVLEEGYIRLAASDRIANTSVFRFAANNDARFQMQGFSETLGGLDSGSSTGTQVVEGATNAAATLTLSVGSGSYTYGGFLRDSASGIHANNLSLVKDGAGTQVLSGGTTQVNYSGSTTVNAGVLEFAGTNNAANNSAITLAGGTVRFSGGGMRSNTIAGTGNLEKTGANTLTLSGSNSYTDGTTISGGTLEMGNGGSVAGNITNNALLSINRTDSSTLGNLVSGTGALNKSGSGTATMTASNSYSGATAVNGGVLRVASGGSIASSSTSVNNSGTLVVDGTAGNVTVNSGGTLKGTGTVGALEIASGGTLAVGNSPGQLNAGTTTWASGGAFEWEINSFPGTAGTNWDFLNITGNLNITATSSAGSQFLIDVVSLLPGADSFNPMVNYSFAIATASAGITGFDVDKFTLSTTRFLNGFDGLWSINTAAGPSGGSSQSLVLSYTASATAIPEPSTCALLTLAAAGLMLRRPRSAPRT